MPQLDIVTFFSQFFWLSLFFIGFYYILYKYFLPSYSRCILFRDKLTSPSLSSSKANIEENSIEESISLYTSSAVGFSKNFFQESKNNTEDWHRHISKKTNESNWKNANLLYVTTFGARQASKQISMNCISTNFGSNLYTIGLSKVCLFYNTNVKTKIPGFSKKETVALESNLNIDSLNLKSKTSNQKSKSSGLNSEKTSQKISKKKASTTNAKLFTEKSLPKK